MIRPFVFALAVIAFALTGPPAAAQAPRTPAIACRVLLPESPIPGNPGHSIMMLEVTVAAGHDGHRHQHDSVEYLHVISGSGSVTVEGSADTALSPGTVVTIPRKTPHQIHNASATAPLAFTATFIEGEDDHTITVYLGEADTQHGCPHQRPGK